MHNSEKTLLSPWCQCPNLLFHPLLVLVVIKEILLMVFLFLFFMNKLTNESLAEEQRDHGKQVHPKRNEEAIS